MATPSLILISVTIPVIAMGLLVWAKLRRIIILLEEVAKNSRHQKT